MKVSLNWVKEFTDVKLPVDKLVEKIGVQLGAVEEVVALGKKYEGIVVAKVVTCQKHPDADKLKLCTIDDGGITPGVKRDKNGLIQVVCGAPNVKVGMLVAWLPPGTTVPSTYDKDAFTLEAREIRGKVSNGMLASASELTLGDDHSGILEIDVDAKPGDDFAKIYKLDDYIIDIENKMFTHRPDLFGILGVAREIAGIQGIRFESPDWYKQPRELTSKSPVLPLEVKNELPERVPRFMAVAIENVDVQPSPVWMQAYLSRVGIRPINNIVDVTNQTMYLTAQPLHAYDYDKLVKIAGTQQAVLETRMSKKGDTLKLLNGKDLKFEDDQTILISSGGVPVGIGGVMGGADTEVDENTKNVVLECANFDMYSIRRTAMRYGLFTDAVTRFNKGQSSLQNPSVMQKATDWIVQLAGGKPGKAIDTYQKLPRPIAVHVTADFIGARLGLKLPIKDMARLLKNVEFEVAINGPTLVVTPPFWRTDIEIAEDIVEEIGRLYGYDHLPLKLPERDLTPPKNDPLIELKNQIRNQLAAAGANESLTYSFVHGNLLDKVGQDRKLAHELANALSPDLQYYRQSLTPSLLEKVHPNIKAGHSEFALFELGKTHVKGQEADGLPKEFERLALIFAAENKSAYKPAGAPYYEAYTYLSHVLRSLGLDKDLSFQPIEASEKESAAYYQPGRSATIMIGGTMLGRIGEYKPSVTKALKLPDFAAGFELDLEAVLAHADKSERSVRLSKFPKVEQDICLKVSAELSYGQLYDFVDETTRKLKPADTRATLSPIDIYQREDDQKHKQVTLRLSIVADDRTLTDVAVNTLLDEAAKAAHQKFGADRI